MNDSIERNDFLYFWCYNINECLSSAAMLTSIPMKIKSNKAIEIQSLGNLEWRNRGLLAPIHKSFQQKSCKIKHHSSNNVISLPSTIPSMIIQQQGLIWLNQYSFLFHKPSYRTKIHLETVPPNKTQRLFPISRKISLQLKLVINSIRFKIAILLFLKRLIITLKNN